MLRVGLSFAARQNSVGSGTAAKCSRFVVRVRASAPLATWHSTVVALIAAAWSPSVGLLASFAPRAAAKGLRRMGFCLLYGSQMELGQ